MGNLAQRAVRPKVDRSVLFRRLTGQTDGVAAVARSVARQ
jgi:hypothetical protein